MFVRISTFMVTAPIFSGRQIPATYKIGLSAALSIVCAGAAHESILEITEGSIILLILKELMVGLVLGMVANILFYAVQIAGTLLDLQIGFSMASLFDPSIGMNTQLTGRLQNILAILVLLSTNAHHLLIQGILSSYDWIHLKDYLPSISDGRVSTFILECFNQMFVIGFMMAAPIMGTLFIVDVAIGIISKTVPQMNIFAVAPPVKILLHFALYIVILPSFFYLLKILFENMFDAMAGILRIMGA